MKKEVELEAAASPDEGTTANVNPGAIGATAAVLATLFSAFQVFQTGQSEAPLSLRVPVLSAPATAPLPATVTKDIDSKLVAKKKEAEEDNAKQAAASTTTPTGNASGIRSFFDYYY